MPPVVIVNPLFIPGDRSGVYVLLFLVALVILCGSALAAGLMFTLETW